MSWEALVGGAAATALMTPINYWLNKEAAEQNQEYYRENLAANYQYSQQAQRNAASNEVAGLRAAGLSPVLANGAAGAPIPAAQGGTMQAPNVDPANLLLMAQIKNLDAQTDKTSAEAESVKQQTGEKQTSGKTAALNLQMHFTSLAAATSDPNLKNFYEIMAKEAQESGVFGKGAQDSLQAFQQLRAESFESAERIIKARLNALVAEVQLNKSLPHGEYLDKLTDLPQKQYDKIISEIAALGANKQNLDALAALYTSEKTLNETQVEQVKAMTKKLEAYNLPELIKSGDSLGALAAFFGLLLEAIAGMPSQMHISRSSSTSNSTSTSTSTSHSTVRHEK